MFKEQIIVFQGDSITDCGRDKVNAYANTVLGCGYVSLIASDLLLRNAGCSVNIFNRGISGNRIVDLYARWKIDMINLAPTVLSILIGVNDTWHHFNYNNGVEVERYEQFFKMLLDWTKKSLPNCNIILCEPFVLPCGVVTPEWKSEMEARGEIVRTLSNNYHTLLAPFQNDFDAALKRAPAEYWASDGVHPTLAGHALMKESWLKTAVEVLL
jgi:lysophospholipase L1-like esterase